MIWRWRAAYGDDVVRLPRLGSLASLSLALHCSPAGIRLLRCFHMCSSPGVLSETVSRAHRCPPSIRRRVGPDSGDHPVAGRSGVGRGSCLLSAAEPFSSLLRIQVHLFSVRQNTSNGCRSCHSSQEIIRQTSPIVVSAYRPTCKSCKPTQPAAWGPEAPLA